MYVNYISYENNKHIITSDGRTKKRIEIRSFETSINKWRDQSEFSYSLIIPIGRLRDKRAITTNYLDYRKVAICRHATAH